MTIPATASTAWAIVGIPKEEKPDIIRQPEILSRLIAKVELQFELPLGTLLYFRNSETGKPYKRYNSVNLSHIRKAIILRLHEETECKMADLGPLINLDRTTSYRLYSDARKLIKVQDEEFAAVYETVKQIPFE